jgi:hypothetical protein
MNILACGRHERPDLDERLRKFLARFLTNERVPLFVRRILGYRLCSDETAELFGYGLGCLLSGLLSAAFFVLSGWFAYLILIIDEPEIRLKMALVGVIMLLCSLGLGWTSWDLGQKGMQVWRKRESQKEVSQNKEL